MSVDGYIFHAEWCPHCVTLMKTMGSIADTPLEKGKYNVNGTVIVAIERNDLNNPETKKILGNTSIVGFPTILMKKEKELVEYVGARDSDSLIELFKEYNTQQKNIKNGKRSATTRGGRRKPTRRKPTRRKTVRRKTTKRKTTKRKTMSWLF